MEKGEFEAAPKQVEPKQIVKYKTSKGAVFSAVFFALVAAGLGVWIAILLLNPTKCNDTKNANDSNGDKAYTTCEPMHESQSTALDDDKEEAVPFDYAGAQAVVRANVAQSAMLSPIKIDYTKDGKFIYIIGNISEGVSSQAAILYRENVKGGVWAELQSGQTFGDCNGYSDTAKKFMSDYKYIDDDLDSKYIGCNDSGTGKTFPE